MKGFDPLYMLT